MGKTINAQMTDAPFIIMAWMTFVWVSDAGMLNIIIAAAAEKIGEYINNFKYKITGGPRCE